MVETVSDHLPILVECHNVEKQFAKPNKNFKYENMWINHERDTVHDAWSQSTTYCLTDMVHKLDICKQV